MTTTNVTTAQARDGQINPEGYRWAGGTITYSITGAGASWAAGYDRGVPLNALTAASDDARSGSAQLSARRTA